ncbi:CPBP family intramembrane metalloprotease [Ornithinimicrobium faecis]|uniref:CPBP family intramembrane metalloprotease n=1 Tax=Ornithinimicrobium faecis TaxID=2934158 RepID=A0ABY4YUC8_9MICO|nr:CPBP family intramembrane glutamic endopeptidase [Ornithinimicrobium sp. HY1793]USQ79767.1 CPBP family intramembrane metalloprotease [Ornithinimicrobium sp. HY1793]
MIEGTLADRRRLVTETLLVLGVSLGASAIWSLLSLLRKLTAPTPLAQQTTAMNTSRAPQRPWLDLAYQLADILLPLVPVLLALFLLAQHLPRPHQVMGLDLTRPAHDILMGLGLAAVIGLPGLALYLGARELGFNTTISAAGLPSIWWGVPVLVLAAIGNAVLEEVVMVGYLFTRWAQAGWSTAAIIVTSALVRGSYHLYQGFGGFIGNIAMGLILGVVYARTKRVMPLVIAHTVLDVVAFVGYALVAPHVSWL